jgi:hypothetical protein
MSLKYNCCPCAAASPVCGGSGAQGQRTRQSHFLHPTGSRPAVDAAVPWSKFDQSHVPECQRHVSQMRTALRCHGSRVIVPGSIGGRPQAAGVTHASWACCKRLQSHCGGAGATAAAAAAAVAELWRSAHPSTSQYRRRCALCWRSYYSPCPCSGPERPDVHEAVGKPQDRRQ